MHSCCERFRYGETDRGSGSLRPRAHDPRRLRSAVESDAPSRYDATAGAGSGDGGRRTQGSARPAAELDCRAASRTCPRRCKACCVRSRPDPTRARLHGRREYSILQTAMRSAAVFFSKRRAIRAGQALAQRGGEIAPFRGRDSACCSPRRVASPRAPHCRRRALVPASRTVRKHAHGRRCSFRAASCRCESTDRHSARPRIRRHCAAPRPHRVWRASNPESALRTAFAPSCLPAASDAPARYRARIRACTSDFHRGAADDPLAKILLRALQ